MFLGQYAPAIAAADELIETMPEEVLRTPSPPMADFFESDVSIRQHVLVRFGKWREIIAQDLPADRDLYRNTVAMIHYAKGVAHAALSDVPAAEAEQALFREAVKRRGFESISLQRRVRNEPDPLAAGTPVNTPIGSVPPGYPSPWASAPLRVRLRCPWYDHARDRKQKPGRTGTCDAA